MNKIAATTRPAGITSCDKQRGIALVIVLWVLALLTVLAAEYSRTMRTETLLAANLVHSAQAKALAEAGIWQGVTELLAAPGARTWKPDGSVNTFAFQQGTISASIQEETGKIDLNTARPELLEGLLRAVDVPERERLPLLQAILDWRDGDHLSRDQGAEDGDYQRLGYDYGAKDGPFNTIDELQLVRGMTPDLFRKMRPALTIYSEQPGIQPMVAPPAALLALPGMSQQRVDEIISSRAMIDSGQAMDMTQIDPVLISKFKGNTYTISSEGAHGNAYARLDVVVVIIPRAKPKLPYLILSWREDQGRDQQPPGVPAQDNNG